MILETNKIRLEPTKPEHLQEIIKIEQDNPEFIGQYNFREHNAVIENDNELHLSIFEKSDNILSGHIILAGLTNTNNSIEFRRIVVTKKGKGIGRDAIMLIKKYCFESLQAHRVWLDVFSDNYKAIRLYKTLGFKIEGLLRECIRQDDLYRSQLIMSILKSEEPTNHSHINYNNKRFVAVENSDNGDITSDLIFYYFQNDNIITSEYSGGSIQKGHLIGLVDQEGCIDMRYHHINAKGEIMTGVCKSTPEIMKNGKIRLYERWKWTSGDKSNGESILEEI